MSDALACGLWHQPSGLAAFAWRLGTDARGLIRRDGETSAASAEIEDLGDRVRLRLGAALEAELSVGPGEFALAPEGSPRGAATVAPCEATVNAGGGNGRSLKAGGELTRWEHDPTESAGLLRHLVMPIAEGGLLVLLAGGDASGPHSEERTAALLLGPEGEATSFPEALLSTEYDAVGAQSRAGLELWSEEEEGPTRAAGTALGGASGPHDGVRAALLDTSVDGIEGLGSYLIWRG